MYLDSKLKMTSRMFIHAFDRFKGRGKMVFLIAAWLFYGLPLWRNSNPVPSIRFIPNYNR